MRPPVSKGGWLEDELCLQLNHSRGSVGPQSRAVDGCGLADGLSDLPELAAVGVRIRKSKVRMIEEVEESRFNRELGTLPFGEIEGFLHVEVGVEVAGPAELITTLDTKVVRRVGEVSGAIAGIGLTIKQLGGRGTAVDIRCPQHVGEHGCGCGRTCAAKQGPLKSSCCVTTPDRVRKTGVFEDRSSECPALHERIGTPARKVPESHTPDIVHDKRMSYVVVSIAVVQLADVERIQWRNDVHIAVGIQTEGGERVIGDFIQCMAIGIGSIPKRRA